MRTECKRRRGPKRRGAMLVLIAVLLVAFLITVALSVDVAFMQLARTELRTATDAAARAGAEALSRAQDVATARQAAKNAAAANLVAGQPLVLADQDILFGSTRQQASGVWQFTAGATPTNSLRISGRRTVDAPSGSVPLFFGGLLGVSRFEPTQTAVASQVDRDICLVLDRSGSMAFDLSGKDWSYPPPLKYPDAYCQPPHATLSRWAGAVAAVNTFIAEIAATPQAEYCSLVTYASPGTWCSGTYNVADINQGLTSNYSLVQTALNKISSKPIPGGTAIGVGIDYGRTVLTGAASRPYAYKTMVLLTDGIHNNGRSPLDAAYDAKAAGITIHAITFSTDADQAAMKAVAAATGGKHYHAPDSATLKAIFKEIAATLPVLLTE